MHRLLIDTDPGVDDAHAIMLALCHPDAIVDSIYTVAGNTSLENATANALKILDVMQTDIPVYRGCASPLVSRRSAEEPAVHGSDGLGDASWPFSSRHVCSEPAPAALLQRTEEDPGAFTLVTLGPLTNIATALKLDPTLPGRVRKLVVMGGAIYSQGNAPNPSAEYNMYADPEAAHIVFDAWPDLTLVSWETTLAHTLNADLLCEWKKWNTPAVQFYNRISGPIMDFMKQRLGMEILPTADVLAMAAALEPSIVQETIRRPLMMELAGRYTRGQTVIDWNNRSGKPAQANLLLKVDMQRFTSLAALPFKPTST